MRAYTMPQDNYTFEEQIVAKASDKGNCPACCFRNFDAICHKMTCHDLKFRTVYWNVKRGYSIEAAELFLQFEKDGKDVKEICLRKIAEAYNNPSL